MRNLIHAQWYQLRHNLIFWLMTGVIFIFAIFSASPDYLENPPMVSNIPNNLQGIFMAITADASIIYLIFISAFTAMLMGEQFSNRTIDLEILAGHSRSAVFFSRSFLIFFYSNAVMLFALLLSCLRCAFFVAIPSLESVLPYFLQRIPLLILLNFSIVSVSLLFAVLFRDLLKTTAVTALFSLIFSVFMAKLLSMETMIPDTVYTDSPGIALLLHPDFLIA